jgi:hypothetical protein
MNDHLVKMREVFTSRSIPIEIEKSYDLTEMYKNSEKHLDKLILDEMKSFDRLIFDVKLVKLLNNIGHK